MVPANAGIFAIPSVPLVYVSNPPTTHHPLYPRATVIFSIPEPLAFVIPSEAADSRVPTPPARALGPGLLSTYSPLTLIEIEG